MVDVRLQRGRVVLSPVFATAVQHAGHTLGYIRLSTFSSNAADDMRQAISDLEVRSAGSAVG